MNGMETILVGIVAATLVICVALILGYHADVRLKGITVKLTPPTRRNASGANSKQAVRGREP
jgi:hypothetical protein